MSQKQSETADLLEWASHFTEADYKCPCFSSGGTGQEVEERVWLKRGNGIETLVISFYLQAQLTTNS